MCWKLPWLIRLTRTCKQWWFCERWYWMEDDSWIWSRQFDLTIMAIVMMRLLNETWRPMSPTATSSAFGSWSAEWGLDHQDQDQDQDHCCCQTRSKTKIARKMGSEIFSELQDCPPLIGGQSWSNISQQKESFGSLTLWADGEMSTLWIERVTSWVFIKVPPWFPACQRKRAGPLTQGWSLGFAARVWVWGQVGGCPARSTVNKIQPTRSTSKFGQDDWLPNLFFF